MKKTALLAWRYTSYNKGKSLIMLLALTIMISMPLSIHLLMGNLDRTLMRRANATPLVAGAHGSRFDLILHALYFKTGVARTIPAAIISKINSSGLGTAIPIHAKYRAKGFPVVGTTQEYFDFRQLNYAEGVGLTRLGDCVLGCNAAAKLKLACGDKLMSDPENVFDIAGAYPLNMRITAILEKSGKADDDAIFVDIKTAWLLDGLLHGHIQSKSTDMILQSNDEAVVYNAALPQYTEVTEENISTFHYHGNPDDFPITAAIIIPSGEKEKTLLRGRYQDDDTYQLLLPHNVICDLLAVFLRIKQFLDNNLLIIIISEIMLFGLVILLSLRLRRDEMRIMTKIGCPRGLMLRLQLTEIALLLFASTLLSFIISGIAAAIWKMGLNFV